MGEGGRGSDRGRMRAKPDIAASERAAAVRSTLLSQRTGPLTASPKGEALFVCIAAHLGACTAADLAAAADWYRKAAEQEDEDAQCCLGFLYESGQGVEQSWEEAVRWYRAAAEQDYPRA